LGTFINLNIHIYITTLHGNKTVTITKEAYKKLKMEKMEGESFSELINRLTDKSRKDLMEFAGAWEDFDAEEIIKEGRKEFNKNAKILP